MTQKIALFCLILLASVSNAEFLSEDPAEGNINNAPSLHKYLYGYQNPTVYYDPTGRTAEQFQGIMSAEVEKYRTSGNRTALGATGEISLERSLKASGEIIIKGPGSNPGAHNADLISYDPQSKKISFFDNKIQTTKAAVSSANNLSMPSGRAKSIAEAQLKVSELDVSPQMRSQMLSALSKVARNPSRAVWAVANASPTELAEVNNKVKRVSQRLIDKGVRLADVTSDGVRVLSADESASNGRKFLTKAGKAVPLAGTVVLAATAASRVSSAQNEDTAFRASMKRLGVGSTAYDNHSVQRELAIIAGEEAGGNGGAGAAVTAAAAPAAACGAAYPLCLGAVALAGGFAGDEIGGRLAGRSFDQNAQRNSGREIERIKLISRETYLTTEDESKITPNIE